VAKAQLADPLRRRADVFRSEQVLGVTVLDRSWTDARKEPSDGDE
jgi:hypothetical protein